MKDEEENRRWTLPGALAASLALHAVAAALLFYGLPASFDQPQEDQVVSVDLVPPPEQPKPAPPPPPVDAEKAEPPPPPKADAAPVPEKPAPSPRIEVLKPVFQFGDKDAGPRKSLGASAQESATAKDDAAKPQPDAAPSDLNAPPDDAAAPADSAKEAEPAQPPAKEAMSTPEIAMQRPDDPKTPETPTETPAPLADTPPEDAGSEGEIALPATARPPEPRPANGPRQAREQTSKPGRRNAEQPRSTDVASTPPQRYSGLPGVRRLDSQAATGDAQATTATAGMPRDQRIGRLCASELQQQLLDASYFPDLVPLVTLKSGTVLDVPQTAFRTGGTWHSLRFRCEVDGGATRVTSFTFGVGAAIPRSDWARLRLPVRN